MIDVTPFVNPFQKVEKLGDKVVKTIVKNGKTYKKIEKIGNK